MNSKHIYLYTILLLHPESQWLNTRTMNGYTNEVPISNVDYLPHLCSSHNSMIFSFSFSFARLLWIIFPFLKKKSAPPNPCHHRFNLQKNSHRQPASSGGNVHDASCSSSDVCIIHPCGNWPKELLGSKLTQQWDPINDPVVGGKGGFVFKKDTP